MRLSATSTSISSKTIVAASGSGGGGGGPATCIWRMRYHMFGGQQDWQLRVYVADASNNTTLILVKNDSKIDPQRGP